MLAERRPYSRRNTTRIGPLTILYSFHRRNKALHLTIVLGFFSVRGPIQLSGGMVYGDARLIVSFFFIATGPLVESRDCFGRKSVEEYRIFWVRRQEMNKWIVKFITRVTAGGSMFSIAAVCDGSPLQAGLPYKLNITPQVYNLLLSLNLSFHDATSFNQTRRCNSKGGRDIY